MWLMILNYGSYNKSSLKSILVDKWRGLRIMVLWDLCDGWSLTMDHILRSPLWSVQADELRGLECSKNRMVVDPNNGPHNKNALISVQVDEWSCSEYFEIYVVGDP